MRRIEVIESEIRQLASTEFAELRDRLLREDAAYDRQFECDR